MDFERMPHTTSRWPMIGLMGMLLAVSAGVAQPPSPRKIVPRAKPTSNPTAPAAQVKYKGIWEPISYPDDLQFADVFFTTVDEGWIAGGATTETGAVILHTTDGGDHWEIQLGDPQSSENGYRELRFLDGTHGWAVQRRSGGNPDRLLHTRDGKNWMMIGPMPGPHMDYMFTSETTGVVIREGSEMDITTDGGRSWKPVFECAAKVQQDGLWQNVGCRWGRLQFLTPSIGFAVGYNNRDIFLAKTTDGGATWNLHVAIERNENWPKDPDVFFLDENTGFIGAEQAYKSTDGGQTWSGIVASSWRPLHLRFADPEVAWAVDGKKVTFTTDGGNRWNSREYPFPVEVEGLSLPRRDRGYVVGQHGMIYRYRVAPLDYVAKGLIPAPLISGIDSPLDAQVQQLAQQVQQLAQDAGASAGPFTQDNGSTSGVADGGVLPSGAASLSSDATGNGSTMTNTGSIELPGGMSVPGSTSASLSGCPGVTGVTPSSGNSLTPATSSPGATTTTGASSTGFSQDTTSTTSAPATSAGFVQDTTAASATIASVSATVPQFVSKYRNLNLLITGFQVATQMPAAVQCLKQSFMALKAVRNPQAAMAAVANIQGQMTGLVQMMRVAFQKQK